MVTSLWKPKAVTEVHQSIKRRPRHSMAIKQFETQPREQFARFDLPVVACVVVAVIIGSTSRIVT